MKSTLLSMRSTAQPVKTVVGVSSVAQEVISLVISDWPWGLKF